MTKEWKNSKVKRLSFQKDLEILLEEYDYVMDCQLVFTSHGIKPQIVVDTPENMKGKPIPQQMIQVVKAKQTNKPDVKQKNPEQKPVPESKDK